MLVYPFIFQAAGFPFGVMELPRYKGGVHPGWDSSPVLDHIEKGVKLNRTDGQNTL